MTTLLPSAGPGVRLQARPLIGREQDLSALRAMLLRESVRLVTITGPEGSGKTRLSLQLAAELQGSFESGVAYVILGAVSDPMLAFSAIGHALGVEDTGRRSARAAVREFLKPRQVLLMIDTFDQALIGTKLLSDLLRGAPQLKILVCNRTPLGIDDEHEFKVAPLTLPASGHRPAVDDLGRYTAIQLFIERSQAANPAFAPRPDQAPAMIEICAHLDGLPLAIELAAAHSQGRTAQEIWDSLAPYLSFQSPGARDQAARQQVMRATLDWTIDLLDPAERRLLCELAVFGGGADHDAIRAICQLPADAADRLPALLAALGQRGLIEAEPGAAGERVWMLDTVREHALALLEAEGADQPALRRFAEFYLQFAESAEPELTGAEQRVWLDRLEREAANLHAAMQWGLASGRPELGVRFGAALWRFWLMRGFVGQGRYWLAAALAAASAADPGVRARALNGLGTLTSVQGDYDQARAAFSASLELQRELGNRQGIGFLLNNLGLVANEQGDYGRAASLLQESLAIWRELDDRRQLALTLSNLGVMASDQGRSGEARGFLAESLAIWRGLGNAWGVAMALTNLGEALIHDGEPLAAIPLLEEGLGLSDEVGDVRLATTARALLGSSVLGQGDAARARELLAASLRQCHELGDRRGVATALDGSAALLATQGQAAAAVRAMGAATAIREQIGAPVPPAEHARRQHTLERLAAQLEDAARAAAWQLGADEPLEQTVSIILAELGAGDQTVG